MQGHLQELKRGGRPMTKTEIKLNTLNKGIDELLIKYEDYIRYWENEIYKNPILIIDYKQFIQDLKKLKGE